MLTLHNHVWALHRHLVSQEPSTAGERAEVLLATQRIGNLAMPDRTREQLLEFVVHTEDGADEERVEWTLCPLGEPGPADSQLLGFFTAPLSLTTTTDLAALTPSDTTLSDLGVEMLCAQLTGRRPQVVTEAVHRKGGERILDLPDDPAGWGPLFSHTPSTR